MAAHFLAGREERRAAQRSGLYGDEIAELDEILNRLTVSTIADLVDYISISRFIDADADTRHGVLSMIGAAIAHVHEEVGRPPFDDGLPDETPSAFVLIRELLQ